MAQYYVYSGATGLANGASWANAYTTLTAAIAGKASSDVFFVSHDHSESTTGAVTLTFPGSEAGPNLVFCALRSGSVPPIGADLRATAQVAVSGNANNIVIGGSVSINGVIFTTGSSGQQASITLGTTAGRSTRYANCSFRIPNSNASSRINIGNAGGLTGMENCSMQFGAVGQSVVPTGRVTIRNSNPALTGAVFPTVLFTPTGSVQLLLEGLNLNTLGAGKSIFQTSVANMITAMLKNCQTDPAVAMTSGTHAGPGSTDILVVRSGPVNQSWRTERHNYSGVQTTDQTVARSGGATDGVTAFSNKIVTSANSGGSPFTMLPINLWNDVVGVMRTVTIHGQWASGTVPNDDDIWTDVEYQSVAGYPLVAKATSGKASGLHVATPIPVSTATWNNTPGSKFAMSVSFMPQEKGPLTIYVNAAKPATTFYVDPRPVLA